MLIRAALVLVLTGGSVLAQDDGAGETAPADETETVENATPADEAPATLPQCDALPAEGAGLVDCTLDEAGTILTFIYAGGADVLRMTVTQSAPEGGERRVSDPIRVTGVTQAPRLTDKDEDGDFELWLPVGIVGDETIFELWLAEEDYFFARKDEVIAASPDAVVPRGDLLVLVSPDSEDPNLRIETAMFLDPTGLTEIYRVVIDATAQTCTLLSPHTGATLNAALIEADCADRLGFPAPQPPEAPDISPKEI